MRVDDANEVAWNLVMSPFTVEDAGFYKCESSGSMLTLNVVAGKIYTIIILYKLNFQDAYML